MFHLFQSMENDKIFNKAKRELNARQRKIDFSIEHIFLYRFLLKIKDLTNFIAIRKHNIVRISKISFLFCVSL